MIQQRLNYTNKIFLTEKAYIDRLLFVCLPLSLTVYLFLPLSVCLPVSLSLFVSFCLSVSVSLFLSLTLSRICLSVCLSLFLSYYLFVSLSLSVCLSLSLLCLYLSVSSLSLYLLPCLSFSHSLFPSFIYRCLSQTLSVCVYVSCMMCLHTLCVAGMMPSIVWLGGWSTSVDWTVTGFPRATFPTASMKWHLNNCLGILHALARMFPKWYWILHRLI